MAAPRHPSSSPRSPAVRSWHAGRAAVSAAQQRLRRERWLRVHVATIAMLTLGALLMFGALLKAAGVDSLALRWGLALPLAFAAYLVLLRLWARALLDGDGPADGLDPGNLVDLPLPSFGSGGGADVPGPVSGGGGDFGGAGAGGSWEDPGPVVGDAAGEVAGKAIEGAGALLDGADEAAVVVVPVAVALGVIAMLAVLMGTGLWMLFGVEVLMAVVAELVLASLGGALAYKGAREGWLSAALRHTWRGALAAWLLAVALGAGLDHWLPTANSLPHAVRLLAR